MSGLFEVIAAEDPRFTDSAENYAKQAQASADRADNAASQASASASSANAAVVITQQIQTDINNTKQLVLNAQTDVDTKYNQIVSIQQDVTNKSQQVSTDAVQVSSDKTAVEQLKADTQTIYNNTVTEKNAAIAARTASESARDTSIAKAVEANNSAFLARDWAIKTTGTVDGVDYSAKYWAQQAAISVTGVSSFNGRQGAVVPASGDYTAAMVGALPANGGTVQTMRIAASVGNSKVELGTNGTVRLEKIGNDAVVVTDEPAGTPILKGQVNPKVNVNNVGGTLYSTINKPTPSEINAVSLSGINISGQQSGINFTSSSTWIASHHGGPGTDNTSSKVVLGSLSSGAVIGGHNGTFTGWTPLYLNTYPSITENQEASPVIMANPKRQLAISVGGVSTPIHFPVVSRGKHSIRPSWWIAPHLLRFMDGSDLMRAATNGLRSDVDEAYISKFKFTVRLSVNAPSVAVWNHIYWFDVCGYSTTNSSDGYAVSHNKFCHAQAANLGTIKVQLVPTTENGGRPYYELHFPISLAVSTASDLSLDLTIVAENLFE